MIQLLPGQLHFGKDVQLKTLLGSCVALTLWHPKLNVGGMCHYLLPSRLRRDFDEPLDGRYGDEAVQTLVSALQNSGAKSSDFIAHLYGGADTIPDALKVKFNVGERNIEQAWRLIDQHGFQLDGVDVGDNVPRHVSMDLRTGLVGVKRGQPAQSGKK
ncbi:chemotaxis protein CheD [Roseateles koreensis]|uniref:Probable chemoreceptor glutamine deamidase CheD n=1 Tax=Roseateles koreensis TaxID=2987526 RepID=A0ABT5KU40_9BURK|nr:chemotaxis protein CheD [Roseateles koreensis]